MASLFECTGNTWLLSSCRHRIIIHVQKSQMVTNWQRLLSVWMRPMRKTKERADSRTVFCVNSGQLWGNIKKDPLIGVLPFKHIFCLEFWQHLSSIRSQWLAVDSLVNMRLDNYDLYVLALYPIEPLVNTSVSPLPWRVIWHAAKRLAEVNHGIALGLSLKQGLYRTRQVKRAQQPSLELTKSWMGIIKWQIVL